MSLQLDFITGFDDLEPGCFECERQHLTQADVVINDDNATREFRVLGVLGVSHTYGEGVLTSVSEMPRLPAEADPPDLKIEVRQSRTKPGPGVRNRLRHWHEYHVAI